MEIGDIIYLVLALLLGLLSVIRKKKGRGETESIPTDEEEPQSRKQPNPFDEIFRDFTPFEEEELETPYEEKQEGLITIESEPKPIDKQSKYIAPKIEEHFKKTNQDHLSIAHKLSSKEKQGHPIKSEFNLRKAVIYSEILNRKY